MLAIDTETTGLLNPKSSASFNQPYLTEIYLIKFCEKTFEPLDEFETFIKPPIPIPEFITKLTGIDDETVKNAPSFLEVYDDLCDFVLGENKIVGHNINFDLTVLFHELSRIGFELNFPWVKERIDTVEMSYPIEKRRLRLGQLYEKATGKEIIGAHRAREDAIATVSCYKWLLSEGF